MGENILFNNEYLKLVTISEGVYLETFKKGFSIEQLNTILHTHPEIAITNFSNITDSLTNAPHTLISIGILKERIVVEISDNEMTATVLYNISNEELSNKREYIIKETLLALKDKGVSYGLKNEVLFGELVNGNHYLVAEGKNAEDGTDSIIKMYELQDTKPEVRDDGKVDFYELKLINRVQVGDWLGERIEATDGMPGQTVKGNIIKPIKGKNLPLYYDKNTVREVFEGSKTVLYSRLNGAVYYDNCKVTVSNHLEIEGDVGLNVGNIKFDGYVTINGTVLDGFSVEATKDIEINSSIGLGSIKEIVSTGGSIYIRGGISSKGNTVIKAAKNIYTKFVDNSVLTCGGSVHIGYYCINSSVYGKEVVFDSSNAQMLGGNIKAEIKVVVPTIGSDVEKKTVIQVTGFCRSSMEESLGTVLRKLSLYQTEQQELKQKLSFLSSQKEQNKFQRKEIDDISERLYSIKVEQKELDEARKDIARYLKTHGEGAVYVTKNIHPKSTIIIKDMVVDIYSKSPGSTYFIKDGEIKQV